MQTEKYVREYEHLSEKIQTFHHHVSVLRDLSDTIQKETINYLEIGCFAGGTACFMLGDPRVKVVSVDLGYPIREEVVKNNISTYTDRAKDHIYIKGNSRNKNTVDFVKEVVPEVDILFIDGDHTRQGVFDDFINYSPLVVENGYVVFDDYLDFQHSPEVHGAVNDIVSNLEGYDILGSLDNTYKAVPNGSDGRDRFLKLNEFIICKNGKRNL